MRYARRAGSAVPATTFGPEARALCAPAPTLAVRSLHFDLVARRGGAFPRFAAPTWRGALGAALRRGACCGRCGPDDACAEPHDCAFGLLFEGRRPPDATAMRRYETVPRPVALAVDPDGPPRLRPGDRVRLHLCLLGRAGAHAGAVRHAIGEAADIGIGRDRVQLEIEAVHERAFANGPPVPALDGIPFVLVRLETPMRVRRNGKVVGVQDFAFSDLSGALLRRISMLSRFYGDAPMEADFAGLVAAARGIPVLGAALRWQRLSRWSAPQARRIPIGGVTGDLLLDAAAVDAFWPLLWLGQWTHAGRGITSGLGRYSIGLAGVDS